MLKLDNISKYYFSGNNIVLALRKINLEFNIGEFIGITGESGSGKSTLLNVLSGLDTYEEGKLFVNGRDFSHYTVDELEHYRKDYVGFVFQDYNIIDSYTVFQNVELALTVMGYSKEEKERRALELIDRVGLTKVKDQKAIKLSGGEKQRTVIARTLAKDCQILVCDEPTGNLDKKSSAQIFELLKEISKDKLVIVVTHDFEKMKDFATRKLRLYDGEIVEDNIIKKQEIKEDITVNSKQYNTRFADTLRIALTNIFSVPKKTAFSLFTILFMIGIVFFIYGEGILEKNIPYSNSTDYFINADESRIILTKKDASQFTSDEINQLKDLDYVRTVYGNDMVFDTVLVNKMFNEEFQTNEFPEYHILNAAALNPFDLKEGTLPNGKSEIVISDNGNYSVGDYIEIANNHLLFYNSQLNTDEFTVKIVGIAKRAGNFMYFNNDGLDVIAPSSVFQNSQVSIKITGTEEYDTPNEQWITPDMDPSVPVATRSYDITYPIWIDNSLSDNQVLTFDMIWFDVCRDFQFKKELIHDEDAGLCNGPDFVASHHIQLSAITEFEDTINFQDVAFESVANTSDDNSQKLYMNQATYDRFFNDYNYQITAIVHDTFDGKTVIKELDDLGYRVFYPSQIIPDGDSFRIVLTNIAISLVVILIIAVIFFVAYFVLRNIILSKMKDYLIFRSIGTSRKAVRSILHAELMYLTILGTFLIFAFFIIISKFDTPIPSILRYYKFSDYVLVLALILIVIELMVQTFTKKIFQVSVISALKGIEK